MAPNYIIEYEAINSKICGVVKNPYSGSPVYITEFFDTQELAAAEVSRYVNENTLNAEAYTQTHKKCCGRH